MLWDLSQPIRWRRVGEGGMGIVHSALQNSMGRHVAIKEVRNEVSSPHTIKTLLQEAWITGFLEHPNIVPIYDISKNKRDEPIILMKKISIFCFYLKNFF